MKGFNVLPKGSELPESEKMKTIWRLGILNDSMGEFFTDEVLMSSGRGRVSPTRTGQRIWCSANDESAGMDAVGTW